MSHTTWTNFKIGIDHKKFWLIFFGKRIELNMESDIISLVRILKGVPKWVIYLEQME